MPITDTKFTSTSPGYSVTAGWGELVSLRGARSSSHGREDHATVLPLATAATCHQLVSYESPILFDYGIRGCVRISVCAGAGVERGTRREHTEQQGEAGGHRVWRAGCRRPGSDGGRRHRRALRCG